MSSQKEALSFKDWKSLKESMKKSEEKLEHKYNGKFNVKPTISNKQNFNANSDIGFRSNYNNNFSTSFPFTSNNFLSNSGLSGFMTSNNSNGRYFNNYMSGNNCEPINDRFKNFGVSNNFNPANKFTNSNGLQTSFTTDRYGFKNSNRAYNTYDRSDFFASDCVYPQRDMMQKPLPNPFRFGDKGDRLLQQFDNERYTKYDKKIKNKKSKETQNSSKNPPEAFPADTNKNWKEPEVYISNPRGNLDGKPYISKPIFPEENSQFSNLTYEERKQQWKDYRQAMKPFKNRDFYNAKRVVQRLGKKDPSELTQSETFRLQNAQEYMGIHKARLCAKYPNYVKAEDITNDLGEVYVLKTVPLEESTIFTKLISEEECGDVSQSQPNNAEFNSDAPVSESSQA